MRSTHYDAVRLAIHEFLLFMAAFGDNDRYSGATRVTPEQLRRAVEEQSIRPIQHCYREVTNLAELCKRARQRRRARQTHRRKR